MAQKKSIDEIWRELNAKPGPRKSSIPAGIPSISGISSSMTLKPNASAAKPSPPSLSQMVSDEMVSEPMSDSVRKAAASYDPARAGLSPEDVAAYMAGIQRLVNCLGDPDRGTRRQASANLQTKLVRGDASVPKASPQMLQALVCGPLLMPLVGMLGDTVERCRVVAVELLVHAATHMSDIAPLLPVLMPELLRRMGNLPVVEQAEEIRLGLTNLVAALLQHTACAALPAYAPDFCTFLCRALEDGYHEIKKAACGCVSALAQRVPAGMLVPHTAKLLTVLVANFGHAHSRVRLAVVEGLDQLVSRNAVPAGSVEQVIAPAVRPIAYDRAPAVREAVFLALGRWMGASPPGQAAAASPAAPASGTADGCGPHAAHLLPLLLVGVTDPQAPVAGLALGLVEEVGRVWEVSKRGCQGSAKDVEMAEGPAGSRPPGQEVEMAEASGSAAVGSSPEPQGAAACSSGCGGDASVGREHVVVVHLGGRVVQLGDAEGEGGGGAGAASPAGREEGGANAGQGTMSGPPAKGARDLVCTLLPQLLPPLIKDLTEWTVPQRVCAARSLLTTLVLAGEGATGHLDTLIPALCTAIGDESTEVAGFVIQGVHVTGATVRAKHWLPLALDHLANSKLSVSQRTNALVVLSGLLHASAKASTSSPPDITLLTQLLDVLVSDELRSAAEHAPARQQLLAVVVNTVKWAGPRCQQASPQLYSLLLQLFGCEEEPARQAGITEVMGQVAAACGAPSWHQLASQHSEQLFARLCRSSATWGPGSGDFAAVRALLLTMGRASMAHLAQPLCCVLKPIVSDHEGDARLRLSVLQLMDTLLESPELGPVLAGDDAATLLTHVLLPPLTWRAGKTAAAIRFAAVTALATLLRQRLVQPKALLQLVRDGTLLPLLTQELDEDWYVDVRHMACYVTEQLLLLVGPKLDHEARRAIYPELLKRLDDSSNQVRMAACQALAAFCTTMQPDYCETNSGYLAAGTVIHMDDSEMSVQEAACAVLEALAARKPHPVRLEVMKVRDRFRSKHYCDRVLAACDRGQA